MIWLCVTPEREEKTLRLMQALRAGIPGSRIVYGVPPDDGAPFVVWGQVWTGLQAIPPALRQGRTFWHIDNGYHRSAKGSPVGFYRFTCNGMTPSALNIGTPRLEIEFQPWRDSGDHVVIAMSGQHFGKALGLSMLDFSRTTQGRVAKVTSLRQLVRDKKCKRPLREDLQRARALVTHSSTAAIEAVVSGVPVFVESTSAAAPVGNLDLAAFNNPETPERSIWWRNLMWQQFTIDEMASGLAWQIMRMQAGI